MDKEEIRQALYKTGEKKDFIHLHLHSDFSLKDGIGKPNQYAKRAVELGMPALAITDHGSIGAHPSFFMYCRSVNLKPIVGVEMYLQNKREEVEAFNTALDKIDEKVKVLKNSIKHKKANKVLFVANVDFFRQILEMPTAEFEDITVLDYSEVKQKLDKHLKKLQAQDKELSDSRDALKRNQHIVLLAKNETGRKHITKIVSDAARNGFYYKPRTSLQFLSENKEGIIVTSACLAGIINNEMLKHDNEKDAKVAGLLAAKMYKDIFGEDFYIEIMMIEIDKQRVVNKLLLEIAEELSIEVIVTNDVHYLDESGAKAQEISLMLGSKDDGGDQVTMKDKKRMNVISEILVEIGEDITQAHVRSVYNNFIELDRFAEFSPATNKELGITFEEIFDIVTGKKKFKKVWEFSTKGFWFKDRHQMIDTYIDQGHYEYVNVETFTRALDNTIKLANKVEVWEWDTKEKLPKIQTEGFASSYDYMVSMVREGWTRKAEDSWYEENSEHVKRVKTELSVIRRTEMADYFVIVADYIKYAKNNNVVVGSARGSAAGSLVCYLLDITNIDPLKFNLLFERFLSMSRSMAIYDMSVPTFKEIEDKAELFMDEDFDEWSKNRLIKLNE
jgi:DNA polymerase III alpha subunit